jgi:hypothetical protein
LLARDIWSEIMFGANRGCMPTVASIAFTGFAALSSLAVGGEVASHEYVRREPVRQAVRHAAQTYASHSAYARHTEIIRPVTGHAASAEEHAALNKLAPSLPRSSAVTLHPAPPASVGGPTHVPEFGNAPRPAVPPPPLVSHEYAGGGQLPPQRLFQAHLWQQFGHAYAYQRFVPAVQYPAAYYSWALTAWPHPIAYSWGWRTQPWYATYGVLFAPYPAYSSPDLWMTDYILAQNMQAAYQGQAVTSAPPAAEPAPDSGAAAPDAPPSNLPPPQPSTTPLSVPPAITPEVKAQLDTQIKVQLQDRQTAVATPATLTTESTPPALRANHAFFEVVQPLSVPSANAQGFCSLKPNDYIRRSGGMSPDDWMIPVVVELSAASDCPVGLHTRIGLNDLNAMENEQEAQVLQALQAASKSMGPNGPPNTPSAHPALIAAGTAGPDLSVPGAIERAP